MFPNLVTQSKFASQFCCFQFKPLNGLCVPGCGNKARGFRFSGETKFPPWAWVLTCSVAAVICVSVGVGIVWAKMRKNEADMQKVIGDLKTEVNVG